MQVIRHGSLKVITVRQGFVGVSFADGRLDVLAPGLHRITSVTHAFAGFLPTGQQTLDVNKVTSMTSDNVSGGWGACAYIGSGGIRAKRGRRNLRVRSFSSHSACATCAILSPHPTPPHPPTPPPGGPRV